MIVLEGKGLPTLYRKQNTTIEALRDVDFRLKKGEILGLAGESGSGKSTLLTLIAGLEPPSAGSILLHGRELRPDRPKEDYRMMQMIFQNASASFHPRRTILDSITETVHSLRGKAAKVDAAALSALVGLSPELMMRYPRQLSGGQCQRFAIARAMAVSPDVLLCDEITSALDVTTQAQVIRLINGLRETENVSVMFVSHDLALVSMICDRIMVMKDGVIVEEGPTRKVIGDPKDPYTKKLLDSILSVD